MSAVAAWLSLVADVLMTLVIFLFVWQDKVRAAGTSHIQERALLYYVVGVALLLCLLILDLWLVTKIKNPTSLVRISGLHIGLLAGLTVLLIFALLPPGVKWHNIHWLLVAAAVMLLITLVSDAVLYWTVTCPE